MASYDGGRLHFALPFVEIVKILTAESLAAIARGVEPLSETYAVPLSMIRSPRE